MSDEPGLNQDKRCLMPRTVVTGVHEKMARMLVKKVGTTGRFDGLTFHNFRCFNFDDLICCCFQNLDPKYTLGVLAIKVSTLECQNKKIAKFQVKLVKFQVKLAKFQE